MQKSTDQTRAEARYTLRREVTEYLQVGITDFARVPLDMQQYMVALAIKARDPDGAWEFIQETGEADTYPYLIAEALEADALDSESGDGRQSARREIAKALMAGAFGCGRTVVEAVFETERARLEPFLERAEAMEQEVVF